MVRRKENKMGVDFSHCDASWAYSGFHRFRARLATSAGFDLSQMEGFDGNKPWSEIHDDLVPLLNHSDCDGKLSVKECKQVAPRLRALLALWPDDPKDYDKQRGLLLADGMEIAVKSKKPLRFM
jgi:hypothetical protein